MYSGVKFANIFHILFIDNLTTLKKYSDIVKEKNIELFTNLKSFARGNL